MMGSVDAPFGGLWDASPALSPRGQWLGNLLAEAGEAYDSPAMSMKSTWFTFLIAAVLLNSMAILSGYADDNMFLLFMGFVMVSIYLVLLGILLASKRIIPAWLTFLVMTCAVNVCWYDFAILPTHRRGSEFFFIVIDIVLVAKVPAWATQNTVLVAGLWAVLTQTELTFRFGLLDMPWLLPYDERQEYCAEPPCATHNVATWFARVISAVMILVMDYKLKKAFADSAEQEKMKVAAAVKLAREVAASLAAFDLETAESYLKDDDRLPPELIVSFMTLLNNLRSYRPYLPHALLVAGDSVDVDVGDPTRNGGISVGVADDADSVAALLNEAEHDGVGGRGPPMVPSTSFSVFSEEEAERVLPAGDSGGLSAASLLARSPHTPAAAAASLPQGVKSAVSDRASSCDNSSIDRRSPTSSPCVTIDTPTAHRGPDPSSPVLRQPDPAKTPRPQGLVHGSLRPVGLRTENVTLMKVTCVMDVAPFAHMDGYVAQHTEFLSGVLAAVSTSRGTVDHFYGEFIYASFNAFRNVALHSIYALTAASHVRERFQHAVRCAVITGPACVGTLGTSEKLSPAILGQCHVMLSSAAEAAQLLRKPVICNSTTFRNAALSFPLKVIYHSLLVHDRGGGGGGGDVDDRSSVSAILFALEGVHGIDERGGDREKDRVDGPIPLISSQQSMSECSDVDCVDTRGHIAATSFPRVPSLPRVKSPMVAQPSQPTHNSRAGDEWMYAMEREPGKQYELYNHAGMVFHLRGKTGVIAFLQQIQATPAQRDEVLRAVAQAQCIDLCPRMTGLGRNNSM